MALRAKPSPFHSDAPTYPERKTPDEAYSPALVPDELTIMGDGQLGGDLLATPAELNPEGSEQLSNDRLLDRALNG